MSAFRPATASSGAPLLALSAVVVDTETTGLDTARARVVQIGGVRLNHGKIEGDGFDKLVNPGEPISPDSHAHPRGERRGCARCARFCRRET